MSAPTLGNGKDGPCPGPIVGSMGVPSNQYNGQLRPLFNTTIKGAIWYQGTFPGGGGFKRRGMPPPQKTELLFTFRGKLRRNFRWKLRRSVGVDRSAGRMMSMSPSV